MINDNLDKNNELDNNSNLEPETANIDESNSTVEVETKDEVVVEENKVVVEENKIFNYLDPSIINIKQYEYSELGEDDGLNDTMDDSDYNIGSDTKEKEVVQGQVVRVSDRDVFIDIGFKSEGIVSKNEFNQIPVVGDKVDVFIITFEDRKGNLILSREKAEFMLKWNELKNKFDNSEIVTGTIVRRIKGGMIVDLFPVQGFLPGSQIDVKPITNFDEYIGMETEFKIVKFNELRQNIVLSRKEILSNDLDDKRKEIIEKIQVGEVLEGLVKNITDFGAFIDLGGIDGLLHITDITWGRINHPSDKLNIGDKINVKVIDYDPEAIRVSLGLKQLHDEPWKGIEDKYPVGSTVQGKIVNMMKYGAFVELEEGVEGLIHVSEMSWTRHIKHPTDLFKIGDVLEAKVLTVENSEKKISLGIKQLQDNPWDKIEEKYEVDSIHEGVVKNLTQYGAFVQLEEGVDGLVHISDMSWTEIVKHPKDILNKGDKVKIKILDLSNKEHRLSLGIKQVIENPWDNIGDEYETGKKIQTSIIETTDKGATVKLDNNLEGIILFKSLSKEEKKQIKEIFVTDYELEATVQEIDEELRKIIFIVDFSDYLNISSDDSEDE
jgi:small subunit ribosomal protein S1